MRNRFFLNLMISITMTIIFAVVLWVLFLNQSSYVTTFVWISGAIIVLIFFYTYTFRWLPKNAKLDKLKNAKVVAIIPAFNEDADLLKATILSIKRQSYSVAEIHVVDDGSKPAVIPFDCPGVHWHVQENKGKRLAQALALKSIDSETTDFILTVDSDSVLEDDAVYQLMLAFEQDEKLKGCTGFVVTRNYNHNLITRISDLNIGISCVITRPSRSITGSLETTSGALAMYRKEIFFDNIDHYITAGTYSDDRQLCLYCVMTGKATGVQESVVYSAMPETFSGLVNQRKRWGKGGWKYFPFQVTNLSVVDLFFPFIGMVQWLATPVFMVTFFYAIWVGYYPFVIFYIIMRLTIRYLEAALYLIGAPHMKPLEKFATWLLITPLEVVLSSFILVVVKFMSLLSLKEDGWLTRG
ncbi:glycosyltransferase family 2 protein [Isobaculum melis]|uniref:Hyaluronan synthase n=1 Tax=Isobaculum melis TaxID=142588 RepID=A0A1H9SP66_9LACT|nr:glycosyltransferase family 2 protein [Isobaculum melis]SER86800.1 hyaluronan synthase [Isobaculum melis]